MDTPRHSPGQPYNANSIPSHAANVARMNTSKSQAAAILGSSTSAKKTEAAQANGEKGGRPKGS